MMAHLTPETLRKHHRSLAAVLEASRPDPETLAVHFQGGGDLLTAGHFYALAATEAAEALAFDRAAKLYRLSLELRPLDGAEGRDLRRKLGDALANAGRGSEAAHEYQTAAALADGSAALELLWRAGYQFWRAAHRRGPCRAGHGAEPPRHEAAEHAQARRCCRWCGIASVSGCAA